MLGFIQISKFLATELKCATSMIFSKTTQQLLCKMGVDSKKYSRDLTQKFKPQATLFETMVQFLAPKAKITRDDFELFKNKHLQKASNELLDELLEWQKNLMNFSDGGILNLYQNRSPEYGAPQVKTTKNDVQISNSEHLCEPQLIYRGMPLKEHNNGQYGQSWSLDKMTAIRFSKSTYCGNQERIIASTKITRNQIVYFDKDDQKLEKEVIVEFGTIKKHDVKIEKL